MGLTVANGGATVRDKRQEQGGLSAKLSQLHLNTSEDLEAIDVGEKQGGHHLLPSKQAFARNSEEYRRCVWGLRCLGSESLHLGIWSPAELRAKTSINQISQQHWAHTADRQGNKTSRWRRKFL